MPQSNTSKVLPVDLPKSEWGGGGRCECVWDTVHWHTLMKHSGNECAARPTGALVALYAAACAPLQTRGLCLVNCAGNFEPGGVHGAPPGPLYTTVAHATQPGGDTRDPTDRKWHPTHVERAQEAVGRLIATGIFFFTKTFIKPIVSSVYEFDVDDDLIRSFELAAEDPGAMGTFYQLSLAGRASRIYCTPDGTSKDAI